MKFPTDGKASPRANDEAQDVYYSPYAYTPYAYTLSSPMNGLFSNTLITPKARDVCTTFVEKLEGGTLCALSWRLCVCVCAGRCIALLIDDVEQVERELRPPRFSTTVSAMATAKIVWKP